MPRPADPLPDLIEPAAVGPVTFRALQRDGVTRLVWGELTVPRDIRATPAVRAAALGSLVPRRAAVGRASAVWVHTGLHEPRRVDVLVPPRRRRPDPHPDRVTHECALPPGDLVELAQIQVTTVRRTGLDVARWCTPEHARVLLASLVDVGLDLGTLQRDVAGQSGYAGTIAAGLLVESLIDAARLRSPGPGGPQARIAGSSAALAPVIR